MFLRLIIVTLILFSGLSHAANIVRVGTFDNPPIVFKDGGGELQGLAIDTLRAIAAIEGWQLEFVHGKWSEVLRSLGENKIDLLVGIAYSAERAKHFKFTETTLVSNWGKVYASKNSKITQLLDLQGKRIALLSKGIHSQAINKLLGKFGIDFKVVEAKSYSEALQFVQNGSADAAAVNRLFSILHAKEHSNLIETPILYSPVEVRYASPLNSNKKLTIAIDKQLKILQADSKSIYHQSINNWLGSSDTQSSDLKWLVRGLSIAMAFSILLFGFVLLFRQQLARRTEALLIKTNELEEARNKSEQNAVFLDTILERINNGIIACDAKGVLTVFNRATREIHGLPAKAIPAEQWAEYYDLYYADGKTRMKLEDIPLYRALNGEEVNAVELVIAPKKGEIHKLLANGNALYDNKGEKLGAVVSMYDITEREKHEDETRRLQRELQQSQKMESIGQITGGIAHDFNNILSIINGYSELAMNGCKNQVDSKQKNYLQQIIDASKRATNLVKQMLTFSRNNQVIDELLQLEPVIKNDLNMLRATLPSSIEIETEFETDLPSVMMNETQLQQIILNLMVNARDSMEGKGRIKIHLGWVKNIKAECSASHKNIHGDWIEMSISDTGTGIKPEIMSKIFNPFFTTKPVGDGSGMGLPVIYGIMSLHGGHILVNNNEDAGVTFRILFPPCLDKETLTEPVEHDGSDNLMTVGTEKILIVDDEPEIGKYFGELLELNGYRVEVVTDSVDALEKLTHNPGLFNLVITDQTMPMVTGIDLVKKLRELDIKTPAIICTGFSEAITDETANDVGFTYFNKPVDSKILLKTVMDLLRPQNNEHL